ncbi:hypothetical protein AVEN_91549-1, partial [Araneus ventricosus]
MAEGLNSPCDFSHAYKGTKCSGPLDQGIEPEGLNSQLTSHAYKSKIVQSSIR